MLKAQTVTHRPAGQLWSRRDVTCVCCCSDGGDEGWLLPLFCFLAIAFGAGLGIANVPLVLAVEYFPTNIRAEVRVAAARVCQAPQW